jgi:VRR-NUC domain
MKEMPTEAQEQAALVRWMTLKRIRFFAIPNDGKRTIAEGARFKRCGMIRGVPDLCIPIPSGSYHGCFIELKRRKGGRLSPEQVEWLAFLRSQNYYADFAFGFEEAKNIIEAYLNNK